MKELTPERIIFDRGDESFTKEDFVKVVRPYWRDLVNVNRTNYLFAAVPGDGSKPDVTGYNTGTTINATVNEKVLKCEKSNGKWAIYRLVG